MLPALSFWFTLKGLSLTFSPDIVDKSIMPIQIRSSICNVGTIVTNVVLHLLMDRLYVTIQASLGRKGFGTLLTNEG